MRFMSPEACDPRASGVFLLRKKHGQDKGAGRRAHTWPPA